MVFHGDIKFVGRRFRNSLIAIVRYFFLSRLLRTGIGMSLAQAVTVVAGIGVGVLLARGLGVTDYGRYIFALALVQFFLVPLGFGLPALVMRQVAIYRSQKEWSSLAGILRWSVVLTTLILGIIILGILAWFSFWPNATSHAWALYLFSLALAGAWAFMRLASAVLRGIERVFWGSLPDQVIRPVVFLGALAAVPVFLPLTPALAMALHFGAAMAGLCWALWVLWRRGRIFPPEVTPRPEFHTHAWLASLLPMGMIVGAGAINSRIDIFMLGILSTSGQVGIYGLALLIAGVVAMPQTVVNAIIAPRIARLHATGNREELQRLVSVGGRISFVVALVILVGVFFVGKPVVVFVVGEEFVPSWLVAMVLSVGFTFMVALGPVTPVLLMTGKESTMSRIVWMVAILNALLNFILIQFYGAIGAGIATVVARIVSETGLWYFVRKKTGIRCDVLFRVRIPVKMNTDSGRT